MSDLVERVARALETVAHHNDRELWARTALAAMQTDAEPVAWMYEKGSLTPRITVFRQPASPEDGWTETPLYAHPPIAAPAPIYRHKKRGTLYTVIGEADAEIAALQAHADALADALKLADCALRGSNMNMIALESSITKALRAYEEFRRG